MGNGALLSLHYREEQESATNANIDEWNQGEEQDIHDSAEIEQKRAMGIRIEGAVGMYAEYINCCFIQTGKMHNERMLYQSSRDPDHWLRYTTAARWMVCTTKDKEEGNYGGGFCCCKHSGLLDPSHAKGWFVLGRQGMFRTQTNLKATRMTKKQLNSLEVRHGVDEIKRIEAEATLHAAIPSAIKFQGATGLFANQINGTYKCKITRHLAEMIEDKTIFYRCGARTEGHKTTLLNDSSGRWILLQRSNVLAYCNLTGLSNPCDATRWFISNSSKVFSVQLSVTVTTVDAKDIQSLNSSRRMPSFHSDLFKSANVNSIFMDNGADADTSAFRGRRLASFSMRKKRSSSYTKALERLLQKNKKKIMLSTVTNDKKMMGTGQS